MAPQGGASSGPKTPAGEPQVGKELAKVQYDPFLPVERKLIAWSLGLGVVLLALLIWISYSFFPG
jgi:hypothetical protein